jgi:hypothetical protein
MLSIFKKAYVTALLLVISPALWAAQYEVTVNAEIRNDFAAPTIFGLATQTIPVNFTFIIDTDLAPVTTLPAGTVFAGNNSFLATPITIVPKEAVTSMAISAGDGLWTEEDMVSRQLPDAITYDLLLVGDLADGATNLKVLIYVANSTGGIIFGEHLCNSTESCVFSQSGFALSASDSSFSASQVNSVQVNFLDKSPAELLLDLESVVASINLSNGISNSLDEKLKNVSSALDEEIGRDSNAAVNMLKAFIKSVEAQRNNKISDADATALIKSAQLIIDALLI